MSSDPATQMSIKLAIVDINGTLSREIPGEIWGSSDWNMELLEELEKYERIYLFSACQVREIAESKIPAPLQYDNLILMREEHCCQLHWKLRYLSIQREPFVVYDDNEVFIKAAQEKYGEDRAILVTNMGGGGYGRPGCYGSCLTYSMPSEH